MNIHQHAERAVSDLGRRLHQLRESRGWTLEELAERTDLSKAYLSRIEAGERQASIAALLTLAQVHGLSLAQLFEEPAAAEACEVIPAGRFAPMQANGLTYWPLSGGAQLFNLAPIRVLVPATRTGHERYQHEGEEWLMVLSGRLRLTVGEAVHELNPGDAAHFDARRPHRLDALDNTDAEVLVVACSIPLAINRRRRAREARPRGQQVLQAQA